MMACTAIYATKISSSKICLSGWMFLSVVNGGENNSNLVRQQTKICQENSVISLSYSLTPVTHRAMNNYNRCIYCSVAVLGKY